MSTVWDRAVRALQTVHPDLDSSGHPLAYYCGGPDLTCAHNACRYVSALAEADLLHDGAPEGLSVEDQGRLIRELRGLRDLEDAANRVLATLPRDSEWYGQILTALYGVSEARKEKK